MLVGAGGGERLIGVCARCCCALVTTGGRSAGGACLPAVVVMVGRSVGRSNDVCEKKIANNVLKTCVLEERGDGVCDCC